MKKTLSQFWVIISDSIVSCFALIPGRIVAFVFNDKSKPQNARRDDYINEQKKKT